MGFRKFTNAKKSALIEAIDKEREAGLKAAAAAHAHGVHHLTYYRWKRELEEDASRPGSREFYKKECVKLKNMIVDLVEENRRLKKAVDSGLPIVSAKYDAL